MRRKKLIVANWKMNLSRQEAGDLSSKYSHLLKIGSDVEIVACPSYTLLGTTSDHIMKTNLHLGAQDVFWMPSGAFTGQISASMLLDMGVSYCIVGHSEKRGRFGSSEFSKKLLNYFSDTNETIGLKIQSLLEAYIDPILCVGETLEEREAGKTEELIHKQLKESLKEQDMSSIHQLVVAYEPVWAIGTGKTCDEKEAERICGFIRDTLAEILDPDVAVFIRILYGGSVNSANAALLLAKKNIDGLLVGGASLNATDFKKIVESVKE